MMPGFSGTGGAPPRRRAGRAADRRHGDAAEQVGQQAAEQQADHDVGVGQAEVDAPTPEVLDTASSWPRMK
jgi:hypothetical protein